MNIYTEYEEYCRAETCRMLRTRVITKHILRSCMAATVTAYKTNPAFQLCTSALFMWAPRSEVLLCRASLVCCSDHHTHADRSQPEGSWTPRHSSTHTTSIDVVQRAQSLFEHNVCPENVSVAMQGFFCTLQVDATGMLTCCRPALGQHPSHH